MRTFFLSTLLGSALLCPALFACTSTVKASDFAPPDGGVTQSGDGGVKTGTPIKSPTTGTKDGGTTPKPPPSGTTNPATCKAAVECLGECPDDDEACADACYGSLPDAELGELQDVATCIANSGCETDECVAEACADTINTCLAE